MLDHHFTRRQAFDYWQTLISEVELGQPLGRGVAKRAMGTGDLEIDKPRLRSDQLQTDASM